MERALNDFYAFYSNRHSGRRLFWQPGLSNSSIIASYEGVNRPLSLAHI